MPISAPAQGAGNRRIGLWFGLIFLGEVILLNIAANLLATPDLRVYLIPAISAVVGLHFWPMAYLLRARSLFWVSVAMMLGAAITAFLIARDRQSADALVHGEALANAIILWTSAAASRRSG